MMAVSRSQRALARRACAAALLFAGGLILAACSGGIIGDLMPTATGGLPENAPQRPANPGAYPAVHDQPPARQPVLTDEEQRKLEQDLIAARERAAAGKPAGSAKNP